MRKLSGQCKPYVCTRLHKPGRISLPVRIAISYGQPSLLWQAVNDAIRQVCRQTRWLWWLPVVGNHSRVSRYDSLVNTSSA